MLCNADLTDLSIVNFGSEASEFAVKLFILNLSFDEKLIFEVVIALVLELFVFLTP